MALVIRKSDSWLIFETSGELFMIVLTLEIGRTQFPADSAISGFTLVTGLEFGTFMLVVRYMDVYYLWYYLVYWQ